MDAAWGETNELRWRAIDHGGWEHLLPDGRGQRWLCLDVTDGDLAAFVASLCRELRVVLADSTRAEDVRRRMAVLGVVNATIIEDDAVGAIPVDGVIVHDILGRLSHARLRAWLARAMPAVSPEGFACVTVPNRWSYMRLRRPFASTNGTRPAVVADWLGLPVQAIHPMQYDKNGGRLMEVIPATGYISAKNPSSPGERARRALLGARTASTFCPAFMVLASRKPVTSVVDLTIAEVERRAGDGVKRRLWRYLSLRGKVILAIGGDDPAGHVVVVLARSPEAIARRVREFALLARLAALPGELSRFTPAPLFQMQLAGTNAFAIAEMPGVTYDEAVPGLAAATVEAAAFLLRFHLGTQHRVLVDEDVLARICDPLFETAKVRYGPLAELLERLRVAARRRLAGLDVPLVWLHGDYKVENIIVHAQTHRIAGVIDWEHSDPDGLPLVDLWYLLVYDDAILTGTHFFPGVQALLPGRGLRADWQRLCDDYVQALAIPREALPALTAIFVVHHIARRVIYRASDSALMERVAQTLQPLLEWVDHGSA